MYPYIYLLLPSYAVMAFIGGFVTLVFLYFRLDKFHLEFTSFLKIFILSAVCCIAGSKLLYAVTQIPWLITNFSLINLIMLIPNSGYVFYGGLLGVIFGLLFYTRKDNELRNRLFQFAVPAFPLFHAFGRIGCLLAGCCYGKELSAPWRIGGVVEFYRIPIPVFESIFEFILFAVFMILEKKHIRFDVLKTYLFSYAIFRFINEFYRGDEIRGFLFGLSTSQWISLEIVCVCVFKYVKQIKAKSDLPIKSGVKQKDAVS